MAFRASLSIVTPPAGLAGLDAIFHVPLKRISWPVALLSNRIPSRGCANSQLPACRAAIWPVRPAQSPVAARGTARSPR